MKVAGHHVYSSWGKSAAPGPKWQPWWRGLKGKEKGKIGSMKTRKMGTLSPLNTCCTPSCPNSPFLFPFTFQHLWGRLDLRLKFSPHFLCLLFSFANFNYCGHLRAFIILFNYEEKLIVKASFFNTVNPLFMTPGGRGLINLKHIWGGGGLSRDRGLIREWGWGAHLIQQRWWYGFYIKT